MRRTLVVLVGGAAVAAISAVTPGSTATGASGDGRLVAVVGTFGGPAPGRFSGVHAHAVVSLERIVGVGATTAIGVDVVTGPQGRFSVRLAAGSYRVTIRSGLRAHRAIPPSVTVLAGRTTYVRLALPRR